MAHYKLERKVADQVVYEGDVDNVEINEEVIRTYCEVIGIDFDTEKELLWIAEEGMRAPIPTPWKACRDTHSDELYYFNFDTGESIWDHPLDEYYSKKVNEEREKLHKSRSRGGTIRNVQDVQNPLESRTQPFSVPMAGQSRSQSGLASTLPPGAKVNSPSFGNQPSMKEDGKRFLKSSKKSPEDDGYGVGGGREERIMVDLPLEEQTTGLSSMQFGTGNSRQEAAGYEEDYEEDVDFGGDQQLSEFLLEKESLDPELANLASTGEHETGTSHFSQGDILVEQQTTSGAALRPRNPLAESSRIGQSMTATSFDVDASEAPMKDDDLETKLKSQYNSAKLELYEEHETRMRQMKLEMDEKYKNEVAQLQKETDDKIQKIKEDLNKDVQREAQLREERTRAIEKAKSNLEEEIRLETEDLREKALKAVESERKILANKEEEVNRRLLAARTDIDSEVDRRLGTERSLLESEFATRVAALRKEVAAIHEAEMAKLRTQLEDANFKEQETKRAEIVAAEQRISSVKILDSEMGVSLDRRRAELHEDHENTLSKIRRDLERAVAAARQESEHEIARARADAIAAVEEARRKIAEETERQVAEVKGDGERARAVALTRITGLEEGLKTREDRITKRQRELEEQERRLAEKERQCKSKQEELRHLTEEVVKEETALSNQRAMLEKKRAELVGIQRSITLDEMINQNASKTSRKGSMQRANVDDAVKADIDSHSLKSSEALDSTGKESLSKRKKPQRKVRHKKSSRKQEDSSEEEDEEIEEEQDEDGTTVDIPPVAGSRRKSKGKEKIPRVADLLPASSYSSDGDDDESASKLGHNGKKVRRILLNLLFPGHKSTAADVDDDAHAHTSNSTSSRHSRSHKKTSTKFDKVSANASGNIFDLDMSDEESDVNLEEIRSRIRSERIRALQTDQRNMLQDQNASSDRVSYTSAADYRLPYSFHGARSSSGDIDRYLAARWYQLYRGSAYTSPLRSQSTWQWPIASMSSKYGYVPARDLLKQFSANKLANSSSALYRSTNVSGPVDYSRTTVH